MNNEPEPKVRKKRYDQNFKRSAVELWLGSGRSAVAAKFGATDDDQTTGGQIRYELPNSSNRALNLLATGSTGGTGFGVRFINGTTSALNRMSLQFTGIVWRQSNLPKTLQFYYKLNLIRILSATLIGAVVCATAQDFHFNSTISRPVLENYLSRSISFTELLHDDLTQPRDERGVDPHDNLRLILDSKAKFVGRALMLWGHESNLPRFLKTARPYAEALHQADPDIILQAAEFEIVTKDIATVAIPERVLVEFGQVVTNRNFHYEAMLYANGHLVNHWGDGSSVPDMSRLETRMWFYHLATSYVDIGIEAIHFGQVGLMDNNDPGHAGWLDMLSRVRAYAHQHARRHLLICDAHAPTGGYVENGRLLFDFHSFPLRIVAVTNQPYRGMLEVGYTDSIFQRSKGGITPSGWACEHLPYLVEFDNFGSHNPGKPSQSPYIWGWDEITWFALMPDAERNEWLHYAWDWVKKTDPNGHLEMPGSRVLSPGNRDGPHWYWANTRSVACPKGFNTEKTIREIWGTAKLPDANDHQKQ